MRIGICIFSLLAFSVCSHAQFSLYRESEMVQRWDDKTKRAMAAVNAGSAGKRVKEDPALRSPFNGKKFGSDGKLSFKRKADGVSLFAYDQKYTPRKYEGARSFLGIKNPWFGKKIYEADKADLSTKTLVPNAETKYAVKDSETREFYQADKKAARQSEPVPTSKYLGRGGTQGSMDAISSKVKKDLTIEDIREILNKNR